MRTQMNLGCIGVEELDKYAMINDIVFGDILLEAMGYKATCFLFCKCKDGGYNIGWGLENGQEYCKTFYVPELLNHLRNKTLHMTTKITRNK